MVSRRNLLALGAIAGAGALLPTRGLLKALADGPPPVTPFTVPLPIPPVLRPVYRTETTDVYHMRITETTKTILPGFSSPVLAFNDSFPGPTIKVRRNRPATVRITNAMAAPSAVHLHGANVARESDGHPLDVIEPGASRLFHYPNIQPAATLWYHDHTHHHEAEQVYRGLSGLYLIGDEESDALRLPSGEFDIPLVLRDAAFDEQGRLRFVLNDFASRTTVLVNGVPQPYHRTRHRKYRLRLVNASNTRPMKLRLNPAGEFVQVASDGGLLARPVRMTEIELWPAERAEVVVDFRDYPPDGTVVLENVFNGPETPNRQLLRFDIARRDPSVPDPDDSRVPDTLTTHPDLGEPVVRRTIDLGRDPTNSFYAINGLPYDPNRIDFTVRRGSTELWTVNNTDGSFNFPHSMHVHLVQFRVLDRNGVPVGPAEAYPKDTVKIPAGQSIRMLVRFDTPFTGVYPFHCHFLDHSAAAMMAQLEVVP